MKAGSSGPAPICLITGSPPGDGAVGPIILRDVIAAHPPGTFSVAAITPPGDEPSSNVNLPFEIQYESAPLPPRRTWPGRTSALQVWRRTVGPDRRSAETTARRLADFAHAQQATRFWVILNTPFLMQVGAALARDRALPLRSMVWDPPEYLVDRAGYDRRSRRHLLDCFGRTLIASERVGVVSETMRKHYEKQYRTPCVLARHGVAAPETEVRPSPTGDLRIGFAGALYADDAWSVLLRALDHIAWTLQDRPVRLVVYGSDVRARLSGPANIEVRGWQPEANVRAALATCDLLYLPQPFAPRWQTLARLSYPTKFSTYLAAGRPVLVHGPEEASLVREMATLEPKPGAVCTRLDPSALVETLVAMTRSPEHLARMAGAAAHLARTTFSEATSREQFDALLWGS